MKTNKSLRSFIVLAILGFTSFVSLSQGTLIFEKAYDFQDNNLPGQDGNTGIDWGTYVTQTSDGGYIVIGFTNIPDAINPVDAGGAVHQVYIVKMMADGELDQTFNGAVSLPFRRGEIKYTESQYGNEINQTTDGKYIAISTLFEFPGVSATVFKLQATGLLDLSFGGGTGMVNLGGTATDKRTGYAIIQTPDGNYLAGGYREGGYPGGFGGDDAYLVKIDASTGDILWEKYYGSMGNDLVYKIAPTADGGFVFVKNIFTFGTLFIPCV